MAQILWNKHYGETLATSLERFRVTHPEFNNEKITYAGRLDPLAEGLVLFLTGTDVHLKDQYLGLDKTYTFRAVLGVGSDTYDLFGLPQLDTLVSIDQEQLNDLQNHLYTLKEVPYPPYSSKPVQEQPLFMWARQGRLSDIDIPQQTFSLQSCTLSVGEAISLNQLYTQINTLSQTIEGDFRQQEIIQAWQQLIQEYQQEHITQLPTLNGECTVGSGTYIRSMIHEIGSYLHSAALSLRITRTVLGSWTLHSLEDNMYIISS